MGRLNFYSRARGKGQSSSNLLLANLEPSFHRRSMEIMSWPGIPAGRTDTVTFSGRD